MYVLPIVLFLLQLLLFHVGIRLLGRDNKHSAYFDSASGTANWLAYEQRSTRSASRYLSRIDADCLVREFSWGEQSDKEVCIGVLTKQRARSYVDMSVGFLAARLNADLQQRNAHAKGDYFDLSTRVFLLNAEPSPGVHNVSFPFVRTVALAEYHRDYREKYGLYPVLRKGGDGQVLRHEMMDNYLALHYLFVHESCAAAVVLQDDAIVCRGFLARVHEQLRTHEFDVLKLFMFDGFSSWHGADYPTIWQLALGLAIPLTFLSVSLQHVVFRKQRFRASILLASLVLVFCVWLYCTFHAVLGLSKQYLLPRYTKPGLYTDPSATLVAQLYRSSMVPGLLHWIADEVARRDANDQLPPNAIDLLVEAYIAAHGMKRYLLVPNLVQHVGFTSSIGGRGNSMSIFYTSPTFPAKDMEF